MQELRYLKDKLVTPREAPFVNYVTYPVDNGRADLWLYNIFPGVQLMVTDFACETCFQKGMAQYAVLLTSHVLRFLLPFAISFYLVKKTVTVGAYISVFTAMCLPGVVVIPMAVMFRFIPTMTEEWQAVSQALRLRGLEATGINSTLHPVRLLEYLLVPFLLQCSEVVDEMSVAFMARSFDKDWSRTNYLELKLGVLDWVLIPASLAVTVWNLAF